MFDCSELVFHRTVESFFAANTITHLNVDGSHSSPFIQTAHSGHLHKWKLFPSAVEIASHIPALSQNISAVTAVLVAVEARIDIETTSTTKEASGKHSQSLIRLWTEKRVVKDTKDDIKNFKTAPKEKLFW